MASYLHIPFYLNVLRRDSFIFVQHFGTASVLVLMSKDENWAHKMLCCNWKIYDQLLLLYVNSVRICWCETKIGLYSAGITLQ